jgi:hypothetical protein
MSTHGLPTSFQFFIVNQRKLSGDCFISEVPLVFTHSFVSSLNRQESESN